MSIKEIPFPALTPTQRLNLDIYGYVIIENLLDRLQVDALLKRIYEIEARYRQSGELPAPSCHFSATRDDYFRVDNLPHIDPVFFDYLTHPLMLGMAEEIVVGIIRSNRDRVLILGGYTPTMFQTWNGYEPDPDFVPSAPEQFQPLLTGSARYGWERRLRTLETPPAD